MSLQAIITALDLKNFTEGKDFTASHPTGAYASELLSWVMAGAPYAAIIERNNQQSVTLLSSPLPSYSVGGRLWELRLRAGEQV